MASVSHICAETAPEATRNDLARMKALALAALVQHGPSAARSRPTGELVAAAAATAPARTTLVAG